MWVARRLGNDRPVVVVGHDALTSARAGALVVPLSDVRAPSLIEPEVELSDGTPAGVATTPRVGEVDKSSFVDQRGELSPDSREALDVALRAALDL